MWISVAVEQAEEIIYSSSQSYFFHPANSASRLHTVNYAAGVVHFMTSAHVLC